MSHPHATHGSGVIVNKEESQVTVSYSGAGSIIKPVPSSQTLAFTVRFCIDSPSYGKLSARKIAALLSTRDAYVRHVILYFGKTPMFKNDDLSSQSNFDTLIEPMAVYKGKGVSLELGIEFANNIGSQIQFESVNVEWV